jgi:hypothetical protein
MNQLFSLIDVKIYDDAGHAFENPNNKTATAPPMPQMPGPAPLAFSRTLLKK